MNLDPFSAVAVGGQITARNGARIVDRSAWSPTAGGTVTLQVGHVPGRAQLPPRLPQACGSCCSGTSCGTCIISGREGVSQS